MARRHGIELYDLPTLATAPDPFSRRTAHKAFLKIQTEEERWWITSSGWVVHERLWRKIGASELAQPEWRVFERYNVLVEAQLKQRAKELFTPPAQRPEDFLASPSIVCPHCGELIEDLSQALSTAKEIDKDTTRRKIHHRGKGSNKPQPE